MPVRWSTIAQLLIGRAAAAAVLAVVLLAAVLLAGCNGSSASTASPPRSQAGPVPLSQIDLGASLLAEVDNAQFALDRHDWVAAHNDVHQALLFSRHLVDHPSGLFPAATMTLSAAGTLPGSSAMAAPRLTAFATRVKLTEAQAELFDDPERTRWQLRQIRDSIPPGASPNDLALLRAAASLDLARSAALQGRIAELKTQLRCARSGLLGYAQARGYSSAKELAALIGQRLGQGQRLDRMLPTEIGAWLDQVVAWAGSDRWSPPVR